MHLHTSRTATVVVTLALAGSGLVLAAPSAQAVPVFTTSTFGSSSFAHDDTVCTESGAVEQPLVAVPITENGGPVGGSSTSSVTATGVPTDVMTGSSSVSGSGSVSSTGANLKSIDHVAGGQAAVTATTAPSACELHMMSQTVLDFAFTVTSPGFLTVDIAKKGPAYTEFYLQSETPDDSSEYDEYGTGFDTTTTRRLYLPAGTYSGSTTISAGVQGRSLPLQGSASGSIHATFALAGSQTEAVAGKGKKYVTLPSARSCATHSINASVTGKKRRADQVKQITVFVNDAKVKKVKSPDKGDAITIPVADDQTADVVTEVKLFPRKKGKPGKVYEVSAGYEACS